MARQGGLIRKTVGVAVSVRLLTAIVEYATEAAYLKMLRANVR